MLKSYQLAVAIVLLLACLNPEVSSYVNHRRPNATYAVPAHNYQPGYNHSKPGVYQPNVGFHLQPHYNVSYGFNPQPVYGGNGYRPANVTNGYRPQNGTHIFGRLFKLW